MSTHASIAFKKGDKIKAVFCHWDGGYWHVGKILNEFYKKADDAEVLVDNGGIESLGETPFFDNWHETRDRKKTRFLLNYNYNEGRESAAELASVKLFFEFNNYKKRINDECDSEYDYFFDAERKLWYVRGPETRGRFVKLARLLAKNRD